MNDLEQRISDTLSDQVRAVQAPSELAGVSLARGRAARRRRRQQTAALSVAALVVAVVLPAVVVRAVDRDRRPDGAATTPGPTGTPTPTPSVVSDRPHFLSWLRSLATGPVPDPAEVTPDGPTFRYRGVTYKSPGPGVMFAEGLTDAGLLVAWHTTGFTGAEDPLARYILLHPDGSYQRVVTGNPGGAAISADRSRIAYAYMTLDGREWHNRLGAMDLRTGRGWTVDVAVGIGVQGWSRDGVIVDGRGADPEWTGLWRPGEPVRNLGNWPAHAAGPASDRLIREVGQQDCGAVVTTREFDKPVYSGCGVGRPVTISTDGRRVLLGSGRVRELGTGVERPFGTGFEGSGASVTTEWEDERNLLVTFSGPPLLTENEEVTVRCDIDGRCERASPVPAK